MTESYKCSTQPSISLPNEIRMKFRLSSPDGHRPLKYEDKLCLMPSDCSVDFFPVLLCLLALQFPVSMRSLAPLPLHLIDKLCLIPSCSKSWPNPLYIAFSWLIYYFRGRAAQLSTVFLRNLMKLRWSQTNADSHSRAKWQFIPKWSLLFHVFNFWLLWSKYFLNNWPTVIHVTHIVDLCHLLFMGDKLLFVPSLPPLFHLLNFLLLRSQNFLS